MKSIIFFRNNYREIVKPMIAKKAALRYLAATAVIIIGACLLACQSHKAPAEPAIMARTPVTVVNPTNSDISDSVDFPAITTYLRRNIIRASISGVIESVNIVQGGNTGRGKEAFTIRTKEAAVLKNNQPADTSLGVKGLVKIQSPRDGIVSSVAHQTGDFVQEGDELAVVADINSLVFILEVPYEMAGSVSINSSCSLQLPDYTRMKGKITGRFPEMDKQNQTVSFIVDAGNISKMPENLIASGLIVKTEKKNVQALPRQALLGNETQTIFWVMMLSDDSTAVKAEVKKGIENENIVEILEPVFQKNDRILITGNYGLPDTAAVIVVKNR
jgi:hypothetical protein